ncbi:hypothetical protein [Rhodococcus jostii]|uniref:hypothetical protein n=1 Tax=Rhodococcus jostii TaxID=132919 RepID=UPI003636ED8C
MKFIDGFAETETRWEGVPGQKQLVITVKHLGPYGVGTDVNYAHFSAARVLELAEEIQNQLGDKQ